jgi:hypothetical protein
MKVRIIWIESQAQDMILFGMERYPCFTSILNNPRASVSFACLLAIAWSCAVNKAEAAVGATTPFTSVEAESGFLGGGATVVSLTSPPTTPYSSPQLEASGHAYVQLTAPGQYVQWTNDTDQNITAINLRSCIPDAPAGGGITSTIDLYVNGVFRQAFSVNSLQNYCYEGTNYSGVGFSTSTNIVLEYNTVVSPGLDGFVTGPPYLGSGVTGYAVLNLFVKYLHFSKNTCG